jgi:hypothetical protein
MGRNVRTAAAVGSRSGIGGGVVVMR